MNPPPFFFLLEYVLVTANTKEIRLAKKRTSTFGVYFFWLPFFQVPFLVHTKTGKKNNTTFPVDVTPTDGPLDGNWILARVLESRSIAKKSQVGLGWMDWI